MGAQRQHHAAAVCFQLPLGRAGGQFSAVELLALCIGMAYHLAGKRMACAGNDSHFTCAVLHCYYAARYFLFRVKVGHNPFVLLRNEGILDNAPFLHDAAGNLSKDYVAKLYQSGGSGLNALLQNYWMTIHPPILFLGFASTIVPFAFAYAGLANKKHEWTKAALPWALFSVAVLGTGIMMGAAWAYESLTFGGYWAWDPVENASLVPWLVMVAGLHTNLIYRHSGYSLKSTYIFFILSFILILYSTFLTRRGILGDTSVHAFTGEGMNQQLLLFLSVFVWLPAIVQANKKGKIIAAIIIAAIIVLTFLLPETLTPGCGCSRWPVFLLHSAFK